MDAGQGEELFDLSADLGEKNNLVVQEPELVKKLRATYSHWNRSNVAPLFESPGASRARKNPGPAKVTVQ